MIIDVHTHIFESADVFPQVWRDELYKLKLGVMGEEAFEKWKASFNQLGRIEALIADMDEAGIDKSVVSPLDWGIVCRQEPPVSIWQANEYVAEAQRKYPDRIIGFVGVDPLRGKDAMKLLETAIKDWGLKGVKIMPTAYRITDPEVQAYMSRVNELEVPALIHTGSDPLPVIVERSNPSDLDTLSSWYPKMKMIAAHFGRGYEDLLMGILWCRKGIMYTDLSGLQYELMKSPWHFIFQMRYLMDKVPDAPLMGTDWPFIKTPPMPTHKEWFDAIRNLKVPDKILESGLPIRDFTQEEKDMILGENARTLLGIK